MVVQPPQQVRNLHLLSHRHHPFVVQRSDGVRGHLVLHLAGDWRLCTIAIAGGGLGIQVLPINGGLPSNSSHHLRHKSIGKNGFLEPIALLFRRKFRAAPSFEILSYFVGVRRNL